MKNMTSNLASKATVLCGTAMILFLAISSSEAALNDNLVAYYPLNDGAGTAVAEVINANHGALRGKVAWAPGKLGGGLYFTRTSQTTSYTTPTGCGFINADTLCSSGILNDTDSYTFSAWVKFVYSGSSSWGFTIWGANSAATANGNIMRVGIYDNGVGAFAHGTGSPIGSFDFTDDAWHLVTIAFGTDGNADYYVDGALSSAKAADTGLEREKLWSTANLFHFGMEMEGNLATDPYNGTMDELAIWNRELTPAEVAELYNSGDGVSLIMGSDPTMSVPSVTNPTDDGVTATCQLLLADADDVTLVWAYDDAGETTISTWTAAAGGGSYSFGPTNQDAILSQTLTGLDGDTEYNFRFTASDASSTNWSLAATFVTGLASEPAPTGLAATAGTGAIATLMDLSWNDPFDYETGFALLRSTNASFAAYDTFTIDPDETNYTDNTTSPNTTYHYQIAGVGITGTGVLSIAVSDTTSANPIPTGDLNNGLVAYYPLEDGSGTNASEIIRGNDGTLLGNFVGDEWTTGKLGGGLQFAGGSTSYPDGAAFIEADELLKTVNPTTGVLEDSVAYTFSAWVKWATGGETVWGANTAANQNGNVMRVGTYSTGLTVFPSGSGGTDGVTADFSDKEWHLLTMAMGTDGNADIYFDGSPSISKTFHTGLEREHLWSTAHLFHFGMEMEANSTTDPWIGTMDELAIWNRELTAAEAFLLYNGGNGVNLTLPAGTLIFVR